MNTEHTSAQHIRTLEVYSLIAIILGTGILVFFLFRPFLYALILALVFSALLRPLYEKLKKVFRGLEGSAAFISMLVGAVLLVLPISFLGVQIFQEAQETYLSYDTTAHNVLVSIQNMHTELAERYPALQNVSIDIEQYVRGGIEAVASNLASVFSSFAKLAMSFFIFLIALYYALRDGEKFKRAIISVSPLADDDDTVIMQKLHRTVYSVLFGILVIALIQGALVSIGFALFGVPNAVLWGSFAVIAALIPGIGTSLVLAPAIGYLFLSGSIIPAFGLLAWGIVAVGLVDNFLGPRLMSKGAAIHPIFILLSVLGGLALFGPIGFLLGPIVLSFFFALIEIYLYLAKKY